MYTANTMSSAFEAMGMSLPYSSTMAAEDEEKASAAQSAKVLAEAIKANIRPRDIITRQSIENAISVIMAVGDPPTPCSTSWPLPTPQRCP